MATLQGHVIATVICDAHVSRVLAAAVPNDLMNIEMQSFRSIDNSDRSQLARLYFDVDAVTI